jgi:Fe-S-cluster-containing dehydrogenase component
MPQSNISRRAFLRYCVGTGAVAAAGGAGLFALRGAEAASASADQSSARYALVIDTTKCVGCGACVEACNIRNNLPGDKSYVHILPKGEGASQWFLPVQCQHCADAPCASVCPTRATYHHETGVVLINEKLCVGCKYCEVACPYQARTFDEERGVVDKCWLCMDWVMEGKDPACVQSCILGARIFGRLDDPNSEVSQLVASGKAKPLHPEFNTHPGVLHYVIEGE